MNIYNQYNHLIIVAGHAVFKNLPEFSEADDRNWYLQPFQKGEPPFYLQHINAGIELLLSYRDSLLFFSGGMTRAEAGRVSEARGYLDAAVKLYPQLLEDGNNRIVLEEYARDSYENLCFSLYQYRYITGREPEKISLLGWRFKERRFQLHRQALGIKEDIFHYIGVNNPEDLEAAQKGERKALGLFEKNPHGDCPEIREKRRQRNPFQRIFPYFSFEDM